MRKTARNGLIMGAVLAAGIGLTATPALAASWTVTGANADGSAYAVSDNTVLTNARNGTKLTCELSESMATINNATGHSGTGIGTIDSSTWTNCTGPLGLTFTVTQSGTWSLNAVEPTADPNVGVASITGVTSQISGPFCSATFTGGVTGHYDNSTGILTLDPTDPNPGNLSLVASNVSGCLGLIQNGDVSTFSGDFQVDPDTVDVTYNA